MITAEQLKDVQQRTEALHRYLNIDQKQIEYEEEQLRTQAPDFWDDPKRAEAQMKKVKGIEKWLKDYKEVSTLTDELSLAVDFFKDEIVSEEEVDALYNKAVKAIEALELRNMLRQEEDPMDAVLKINSGAGGTESQDWAQMLMRMYMRWSEAQGYKVTVTNLQEGDEAGIKSGDDHRGRVCLWLPQEREWRTPPRARQSVQRTGKAHDEFCLRLCHTIGGRHH